MSVRVHFHIPVIVHKTFPGHNNTSQSQKSHLLLNLSAITFLASMPCISRLRTRWFPLLLLLSSTLCSSTLSLSSCASSSRKCWKLSTNSLSSLKTRRARGWSVVSIWEEKERTIKFNANAVYMEWSSDRWFDSRLVPSLLTWGRLFNVLSYWPTDRGRHLFWTVKQFDSSFCRFSPWELSIHSYRNSLIVPFVGFHLVNSAFILTETFFMEFTPWNFS